MELTLDGILCNENNKSNLQTNKHLKPRLKLAFATVVGSPTRLINMVEYEQCDKLGTIVVVIENVKEKDKQKVLGSLEPTSFAKILNKLIANDTELSGIKAISNTNPNVETITGVKKY